MRIAIDYTAAVRQRAGIGRYTRSLVGALADLDRANRYVLFSAGRDPERRAWPANFCLRPLPLTDRHLAILWQRLRLPLPAEWITGRVDILHSPDFVLPPVWRARTVLTVHDLSFVRYPEYFTLALRNYLMTSVPRAVQRADLILADSLSTCDDLMALLGVPAERIAVLYPGVDARFTPQRDPAALARTLARCGLRQPYILGLGTLQPRKNFPRLIRAYAALRGQRAIPHQLVIGGGPGWLEDEVHAAIAELGLGESVRLIGFVDDADLPDLYRAADVFAFPSLYEGFGIPVLEAMACGTPVVTSNVSSLPEVAGDAALLVPPEDVDALADALWRLIDDAALRNDLILRGFQQVKRFSWQRAAAELISLYARVGKDGG
ncbi:MAG: glycosyltransferase family 1 protein [Chloroflexota bacterium]